MTAFLTLDNLPLRGKTVLVRADLNVPMQNDRVTDHERLERLLPTLRELKAADARIVILSHFGRPNGKVDASLSLRPIAAALEKIWGQPVAFVEASIGPLATEAIQKLLPGQIIVLENTRFHEGEESNDLEFSRSLAALGDVYINDAFSAAHRAHASTEGIAHHLPSAAGRLMQAEIDALTAALTNPEKPLAALVGGSKISTKLDLLNNLMGKVDLLVLGGGMANTFLAAKGISIGKSLFEPNMIETARSIMAKAEANNCHIVLPKDVVIAKELKANVEVKTVAVKDMPDDWMILDLGPQSVKDIKENLSLCKTIVWNGPLGAFETEPFDRATNEVAIAVAELTKRGKVLSVAGGGDTASALANAGVANGFSYLSTAGGAFLEWLEGKELPGFVALRKAVTRQKVGKVIL